MSYMAEKVGAAYHATKEEGYSSSEAYKFAGKEARKLGGKARCSSNNGASVPSYYPTIVYDMPDGSQAKLMYGGVLHTDKEYWHDC